MNKKDLKVGQILLSKWGEAYRVVYVGESLCRLDAPESRGYWCDGRLRPIPEKKVYYQTRNPVWNLNSFKVIKSHEWRLKKYKHGVVIVRNPEVNFVPEISFD